MPNLYAIQFDVVPAQNDKPEVTFQTLQRRVEDWVVHKYARALGKKVILPAPGEEIRPIVGHSVGTAVSEIEDSALFRLSWSHPDDRDQGLRWSVSQTLALNAGKLHFGLQLGVASATYPWQRT